MTTTALATQSPDRMAQAHKANQPKSGQQTPQTPASNFAALLMLADVEPALEVAQQTATDTTDTQPPTVDTDEHLSPGQLALLGLMNWQSFATASATSAGPINAKPADGTSPQVGTGGTVSAPNDKPIDGASTWATTPLPGALTTQPGSGIDARSLQPVDEALPAEMLATLRAASPDSADTATSTSYTPARAGPAMGMADAPPGAKAKPGTLRHALSTGPSTTASSATTPSTVSLALRGSPADATTPTLTPLSVAGKSGQVTDPSTSGREPSQATESAAGTPLVGIRSQDANSAPATPLFASAMDGAGTDVTPMPPPDVPGMPTPESMEQAMDQLGAHIAYWATQGNQRASLTIGDGQNNPLGVNISFENGEVHVHFETDEAEVKEALSASAEEMLNHMLEARGLALGDVSIGAGQGERPAPQGNADQPGDSNQRSKDNTRSLAERTDTTTLQDGTASGPAGRPAGVMTASKLDFFA